jgi:hypothetical protein
MQQAYPKQKTIFLPKVKKEESKKGIKLKTANAV